MLQADRISADEALGHKRGEDCRNSTSCSRSSAPTKRLVRLRLAGHFSFRQASAIASFDHYLLETGRRARISGNNADMLSLSHFAEHFAGTGDTSVHYGRVESAATMAEEESGHDRRLLLSEESKEGQALSRLLA